LHANGVVAIYNLKYLIFVLKFNLAIVPEFIFLDINNFMIQNLHTQKITIKLVRSIIQKRNPQSHKGTYGHAIIIAGSFGKMGAAVLAARACLRTGVGLLTMYVPKSGYSILQTTIPEAMVICDDNEDVISSFIPLDNYNVVGIGCGLGKSAETQKALQKVIKNFKKPMVIDADAINIIADNIAWLKWIPAESIFTPHAIEFERLVGKSNTQEEQNKLQMEFSQKYKVYVVLKGHHTSISCPNGSTYINTTGNAGMAKGGTGDTLTGMLTALLAQGYKSEKACIAGVFLHGLAGDRAVKETGEFSLLASDLINTIGKAFLEITQLK
jgi:hydroxyethylthiazole kinase-like uncharacterized protein yjeF